MKFGVQAAIQGLKFDFSTITSKILSKKIYIKATIKNTKQTRKRSEIEKRNKAIVKSEKINKASQ